MIPSDFDPLKPYRYFEYLRMSDPMQNSRSPQQQHITIRETLQRCGFPWIHLETYRDDGISGRLLRKRLGFQKMLTDIRTGKHKPDLILVDTIMRFGRGEELDSIQRELRNRHGILVVTADTQFSDPSSEGGRAMRFLHNFQAAAEGRTKAHNVVRGKRDAVRLGHWPGGPAPLGLRFKNVMKEGVVPMEVDYRVLEHDPETADYVREMYRHRHEFGWGTSRSAKYFNSDPEFVRKVGHIDASTIGRILDNPIYRGELVWGKYSTDVVDDRRVIRKNPEDQIVRNENFCEPLVDPAVWYEVHRMRREAGRKHREARQRKSADNGKLLRPRAPGFVLRYPLTGLIRCAVCGASMNPSSSGAKNNSGRRYTYYRCPGYHSGACQSGVSVQEGCLFNRVIAALRRRLFPAPGGDADGKQPPAWFAELFDEVQAAHRAQCQATIDRSPLLKQECEDLRRQVNGWILSLSKTDLSGSVRRLVEDKVDAATARIDAIDRDLAELEARETQLEVALDPQVVLDALHRLDEVLEGARPNRTHAELALHIDRIEVHPDRRVTLYTCKLGALHGIRELLTGGEDRDDQPDADDDDDPAGHRRIRPRRRPKLKLDDDYESDLVTTQPSLDISDPHRFAGLPATWFWRDDFDLPSTQCWSVRHAQEVARVHREQNLTRAKLAEYFHKSIPTIRKALLIAEDQGE